MRAFDVSPIFFFKGIHIKNIDTSGFVAGYKKKQCNNSCKEKKKSQKK